MIDPLIIFCMTTKAPHYTNHFGVCYLEVEIVKGPQNTLDNDKLRQEIF